MQKTYFVDTGGFSDDLEINYDLFVSAMGPRSAAEIWIKHYELTNDEDGDLILRAIATPTSNWSTIRVYEVPVNRPAGAIDWESFSCSRFEVL